MDNIQQAIDILEHRTPDEKWCRELQKKLEEIRTTLTARETELRSDIEKLPLKSIECVSYVSRNDVLALLTNK